MFKDISIKIGLVIQRESGPKSIYWGYTMGWNILEETIISLWTLVLRDIHEPFVTTTMIVKSSYGVPNSNPVTRKSLTFRSKNNNKTHRKVKLFLATGFEFEYSIIALYFSAKIWKEM